MTSDCDCCDCCDCCDRDDLAAKLAAAERKAWELRAQLAHRIGQAFDDLPKAGTEHLPASGVIVTFTALGGREIVAPVMIRNGLSAATIAALQDDLCRTFEAATMVNPAMARHHNRNRNEGQGQ